MFKGMQARMQKEIQALAPSSMNPGVEAPADRKHSAWLGGAILSNMSRFEPMWIKVAPAIKTAETPRAIAASQPAQFASPFIGQLQLFMWVTLIPPSTQVLPSALAPMGRVNGNEAMASARAKVAAGCR